MMSDEQMIDAAEEVWVTVSEAMKLTSYSRRTLYSLIWRIAKLPEDQREIRLRQRINFWELWLPDLYAYLGKEKRGPIAKRNQPIDKP